MELLLEYRKGRDGFDDLVLEAARLYGAGELFPPLGPGEERDLNERLQALGRADVERALAGKLGTVPMTREEYEEVLDDIVAFLKEWLGED